MSTVTKTNPMAIPAPVPEHPPSVRALVLKPHRAGDSSQLELSVNDIVCVLEKDASGWWGGHKEGEEATGWFPGSCVREIIEKDIARPPTMSPTHGNRDIMLAGAEKADSTVGDKDGKDVKDARERRLSPVWKRITRESSPGFSHTVDIEFSRKSDDRFQSIQLIRPSSPASSIASGVQSMPTGSDANREIKRLRDLVAELRHAKRQCDTEIRQLRNNASQQETEAAAKRAENAALEHELRAAGHREELLIKEVETLRHDLHQEKQSTKQLKQDIDEKNLELKLLYQTKEDSLPKSTTTTKPSDFAGSAEALRKRLFVSSLGPREDASGTAPFAAVSRADREDDMQSIASSAQVAPSGISTLTGAAASDKVQSPPMRQSEPRPAPSTVSTADDTISSTLSSTTSTAVGLAGQRPSPYSGAVNVPRPIGSNVRGSSLSLPMNTQPGGKGMTTGPLNRVGGGPPGPNRAVYSPISPSLSPQSMSRNSVNGMRSPRQR